MQTVTKDQLIKDNISEVRIYDLSEIETHGLKGKYIAFYVEYIDHVDIEDIKDNRIGKHKYSPQNISITFETNEVSSFKNCVYVEVNMI